MPKVVARTYTSAMYKVAPRDRTEVGSEPVATEIIDGPCQPPRRSPMFTCSDSRQTLGVGPPAAWRRPANYGAGVLAAALEVTAKVAMEHAGSAVGPSGNLREVITSLSPSTNRPSWSWSAGGGGAAGRFERGEPDMLPAPATSVLSSQEFGPGSPSCSAGQRA